MNQAPTYDSCRGILYAAIRALVPTASTDELLLKEYVKLRDSADSPIDPQAAMHINRLTEDMFTALNRQ